MLSTKCFAITSNGCPSLSYIARKNNGNMMIIIPITARLVFPVTFFNPKNTGIPISAAPPKQINCRFVRLKNTLVFTFDKSRGTGTYAATLHTPFLPVSVKPGILFIRG